MKIAVIGLGRIGLPLAAQYAGKGNDVVGVDINRATVDAVNAGREPFPGEAHLAERLAELVPAGRLRATTEYAEAIPGADVVVVVVPLALDSAGEPNFDRMDSATREIGEHLTNGTLVIYETTLPVGTTRNRLRPALESGSGRAEGTDFHVAFSPERVLTTRVFEDLRKYPKLVGGLSAAGTRAAVDFYERVLDFDDRPDLARGNGVWDLGSAEAAEMAKLAETTYRDVNIALANQFARYAEAAGIDVSQVIEASNSQPYSHIHRPGIAVGGHCIPVYPRLYLANDPGATVVSAAREANSAMPGHAVDLLEDLYGPLEAARVVVLGAAYRGGVKETALSGVFPTVEELQKRGASVTVHDPLYDAGELNRLGLPPHTPGEPVDAIVVQTDHESYRRLTPDEFPGVRAVVDGRGVLAVELWSSCRVQVLGRPQEGGRR